VDIKDLRFTEPSKIEHDGVKIKHSYAKYTFSDLTPAIGVDPGRNWGIAFVRPNNINPIMDAGYGLSVYWGTMPKEEHSQDYFHKIRDFVTSWLKGKCNTKIVMVEGASYGDKYGQNALEQCRLGFYEAFREMGADVEYVAPLTPRKHVFGNGRLSAKNIWLDLNHNAADAACIALYGGGYQYDKHMS